MAVNIPPNGVYGNAVDILQLYVFIGLFEINLDLVNKRKYGYKTSVGFYFNISNGGKKRQ
ncbi:MAG: hypothetical protein KAI27_05975 [Rhodospirillaceae bacterium]|nr:hypothetical protein [Rhodospirillaceae bacterium]